MRNATTAVLMVAAIAALTGCGKSESPTPPQSGAGKDSHPVKNVESLPSGTIREGARTMNRSADMGATLEQQKQDRDKEMEAQGK